MLGGHHLAGAFKGGPVLRVVGPLLPTLGEDAFDHFQMFQPQFVTLCRKERRGVRYCAGGVVGAEGVVFVPEEPAPIGPLAGQDAHVAWDVGSDCGKFVAQDCTDRGVNHCRVRAEAGFECVSSAFVVAFLAHH